MDRNMFTAPPGTGRIGYQTGFETSGNEEDTCISIKNKKYFEQIFDELKVSTLSQDKDNFSLSLGKIKGVFRKALFLRDRKTLKQIIQILSKFISWADSLWTGYSKWNDQERAIGALEQLLELAEALCETKLTEEIIQEYKGIKPTKLRAVILKLLAERVVSPLDAEVADILKERRCDVTAILRKMEKEQLVYRQWMDKGTANYLTPKGKAVADSLQEGVSFFEAFEAYENGKQIRHKSWEGGLFTSKEHGVSGRLVLFSVYTIRSNEWEIKEKDHG